MAQRYNDPLSTSVMRSISKSFRRLHLEVEPYRRSRPYGSSLPSQYNASCAGRRSRSTCEERKPLSDFTVAFGQGLPMADGCQVIEIAGANIFWKFVNGKIGSATCLLTSAGRLPTCPTF